MMKVSELKAFLETLPPEFDEFTMSNGEYGSVGEEKEFYYRIDKPIMTLFADENNKELCFLHQTQEEVDKIQDDVKNNTEESKETTENEGQF